MATPSDLITLGIGPGGDIPSILTGGLGVYVYVAPDGIVFLHLPARSTTLHLDTRAGYSILDGLTLEAGGFLELEGGGYLTLENGAQLGTPLHMPARSTILKIAERN